MSDLTLTRFEILKKHIHVFEGCLQYYTYVRRNAINDLTGLEVPLEVGYFL